MNKRTLALALAFAMSLSMLTACGSKETPAPEATEPTTEAVESTETATEAVTMPLELNFIEVTLTAAGETVQLIPNMDVNEVYFGSNDESIAAIDQMGNIIAVAPGTTTVMAENEAGEIVECTVHCDWEVATEEIPGGSVDQPAAGADLESFIFHLADKFGENFAANANVVEFGMHEDMYPGIDTKQLVIYQPMMGAVVCEVAMAEVANASDIDAVKEIFQARIDFQVDGGAWYPESISGWENNSRIITKDNYVVMIAWMYCDEAVADFEAMF